MMYITKSSVLALALALFGASAMADDSQAFHNRAAQATASTASSTTVAVYNGHAAANRNVQEPPAAVHSLRSNGHGQLIGEYRQGQ